MITALFRLGVSGEQDRAREEEARRYFDEHGERPEDPPQKQRQWTLPVGVVSPEDDPPSPRKQFDLLARGSGTGPGRGAGRGERPLRHVEDRR